METYVQYFSLIILFPFWTTGRVGKGKEEVTAWKQTVMSPTAALWYHVLYSTIPDCHSLFTKPGLLQCLYILKVGENDLTMHSQCLKLDIYIYRQRCLWSALCGDVCISAGRSLKFPCYTQTQTECPFNCRMGPKEVSRTPNRIVIEWKTEKSKENIFLMLISNSATVVSPKTRKSVIVMSVGFWSVNTPLEIFYAT